MFIKKQTKQNKTKKNPAKSAEPRQKVTKNDIHEQNLTGIRLKKQNNKTQEGRL